MERDCQAVRKVSSRDWEVSGELQLGDHRLLSAFAAGKWVPRGKLDLERGKEWGPGWSDGERGEES